MFNETNVPPPEFRVRTVVRHVVTRYCHPYTHSQGHLGHCGGSTVVCEVSSEQGAYDIAEAMAKGEGATVQRD